MSLKKPSVPTLTGAAGFNTPAPTTPLDSAFVFTDEDWTRDLRRALEPAMKVPTANTSVEDPFCEKLDIETKQTLFNAPSAGYPMTSTLNTPEMNTPVTSNSPESDSPLKQLLKTDEKPEFEITEMTLPVVYGCAVSEDPNPTTIPVDNMTMFPNDEFQAVWSHASFSQAVWNHASFSNGPFASDPFQCLDPRVAEGLPASVEVDEGIHGMEEEEDNSPMLAGDEAFSALIPTTVEMAGMDSLAVDQGSLCQSEAMDELGEGERDLFQWLVDETIGPDADLPFPAFVKEEVPETVTSHTAEPLPSTSAHAGMFHQVSVSDPAEYHVKVTSVKKKGRGRPPKLTVPVITPKPPRETGRSYSDHIYVVKSEDKESQRYRRMRDLNNEASRRCRQNRKTKFVELDLEREQLEAKNKTLRFKVQKMEEIVSALKKRFISDIANPTPQAKKQAASATVVSGDLLQQAVVQDQIYQEAVVQADFPDLLDIDLEWSGLN